MDGHFQHHFYKKAFELWTEFILQKHRPAINTKSQRTAEATTSIHSPPEAWAVALVLRMQ